MRKTSAPLWYTDLEPATRRFLDALNEGHASRLTDFDRDAAKAHDAFNAAMSNRKTAWDYYARQLTGLAPGDVFRDNHSLWLYVGFSPRKYEPLSLGQVIDGKAPKLCVDMWVLPFTNTAAQVQYYYPKTLPLAAVQFAAEVPKDAKLWVTTRDPALDIPPMDPPWVRVEARVKIAIEIPVSQRPRLKKRKR